VTLSACTNELQQHILKTRGTFTDAMIHLFSLKVEKEEEDGKGAVVFK
jgi:hypothetical protein